MDKIREEMYELESRETELLKKRTVNPTYHRSQQKQQHEEREKGRAASLDSQLEKQGALTKKPIFGSRDDLVAFFGTAEGRTICKMNFTMNQVSTNRWLQSNLNAYEAFFQLCEEHLKI